jgi:hypothetical protein
VPVARKTLVNHFSSSDIQSGEERRGTVALVVEGHGSRTTFLQGQAGLGSVKGLDLALLVEREDDRPFGRRDVEPTTSRSLSTK